MSTLHGFAYSDYYKCQNTALLYKRGKFSGRPGIPKRRADPSAQRVAVDTEANREGFFGL